MSTFDQKETAKRLIREMTEKFATEEDSEEQYAAQVRLGAYLIMAQECQLIDEAEYAQLMSGADAAIDRIRSRQQAKADALPFTENWR